MLSRVLFLAKKFSIPIPIRYQLPCDSNLNVKCMLPKRIAFSTYSRSL